MGTAGAPYYTSSNAAECDSVLEMPDGRDPRQNGWLTITINYTLNFVDRHNPMPGLTVVEGGKLYAKPSDPGSAKVPIRDWDWPSRGDFTRRFADGEKFWNYKFLLITPQNYDAFDFTNLGGVGLRCRPNVICLFRLKSGGSPNHLRINAVRKEKDSDFFRSNKTTYDNTDVGNKTLWHELGHALDQLHIQALLGNPTCMIDVHINDDPCYVTPAGMAPNIMGKGEALIPQNGKAWRELIAKLTKTAEPSWAVSLSVNTPPRTVPIGLYGTDMMPRTW